MKNNNFHCMQCKHVLMLFLFIICLLLSSNFFFANSSAFFKILNACIVYLYSKRDVNYECIVSHMKTMSPVDGNSLFAAIRKL